MDDTQELLRRRLERERTARKTAEAIIEQKSRELYAKSRELEAAVAAETQARRESEALRDALEAFTSGLHAEDVLRRLGGFLERLVAFDRCAVYVVEDGPPVLKAVFGAAAGGAAAADPPAAGGPAARGAEAADLPGPAAAAEAASPPAELPAPGPAAHAAPSASRRLCEDLARSAAPLVAADAAEAAGLAAAWGVPSGGAGLMLVPMLSHARTAGCLVVSRAGPGAFDAVAARFAQALANEAALALENARLFAEVERLSQVDALTGLHNRRHFAQASAAEWERARRYGLKLAALLLDIDHFKVFNDTYGHAAGDRVLKDVAAVCLRTIRRSDLDARYGGEELCFLLPETGLGDACALAERLRAGVAALRVQADDRELRVTVSVGATERGPGDTSVDDLLRRADEALYEAKRDGRDRVVARALSA